MAFLLVVSGPPGAGKSTVSRILADKFEPSVLVEGDAFFGFQAFLFPLLVFTILPTITTSH
jgi:cytidylate kinase